MSKVQMLRAFVNQRLTAAAEEIFGLFERTIAEHEEELCRSKEENERQQKLLDAVLMPEVRLHRAVCPADVQQLSVSREEVPPEDWSPHLDQDPPEPPHIKEEQEEVWTSQEGEFTFSRVPVKTEEEEAQSSQLHHSQTVQVETGADGEDCGGPEAARNPDPDALLEPETEDSSDPQTDDSNDWTETRKPQSCSKSHNNKVPVSDVTPAGGEKQLLHGCSDCGKRFGNKTNLKVHMRIHTGGYSFACLVCGKVFAQGANLRQHMAVHTGGGELSCSVCDRRFTWFKQFTTHKCICLSPPQPNQTEPMETEPARNSDPDRLLEPETREPVQHEDIPVSQRTPFTGQRLFSCSVCGRKFRHKGHVKEHMSAHVKNPMVDHGTSWIYSSDPR